MLVSIIYTKLFKAKNKKINIEVLKWKKGSKTNLYYLLKRPKSSKPNISSTPIEFPWWSLRVSFLERRAWLTWRTIQSNKAPYKHFAIASLAAVAYKNTFANNLN